MNNSLVFDALQELHCQLNGLYEEADGLLLRLNAIADKVELLMRSCAPEKAEPKQAELEIF